jgi:hypothetical protein
MNAQVLYGESVTGGQLSTRTKMMQRNANPAFKEIHNEQSRRSYNANRTRVLERKKDLYHQRMATLECSEIHAGVMF